MKRTTVSLPDEVATLLEREARRTNVSLSKVTRRALSAYLGLESDSDEVRALPFAALGRSGHKHTARDIEKILAQQWNEDRRR